MILLSHPTGNENVRQAALAFQEAGLLQEFWTCLSWNADGPANRFLPAKLRQQLSRRSFHPALRPLIHTAPAREMGRLLASAIGVSAFSQHETGPLSIDAVFGGLDRKVAGRLRELADCQAVYCYEDGALETFRAAQERNLPRLYDLPIGYWRVAQQIYAEERTREPEWAVTLSGIRDSAGKLARKEEELKLATSVVVASSFTRETLRAAEFSASVTVIPYGAPAVADRAIDSHSGKSACPVRGFVRPAQRIVLSLAGDRPAWPQGRTHSDREESRGRLPALGGGAPAPSLDTDAPARRNIGANAKE